MKTPRHPVLNTLLGLLLLGGTVSSQADWPATKTTVNARPAVRTGRTEYVVKAVVFAHGATIDKVQFAGGGHWGVDGHFVRQRRNGGLVYKATIFGHPGLKWQARSFVQGRPDDVSDVAYLP